MYKLETLTFNDYVWCVEVAAVRMLVEEVKRPELVDIKNLYLLASKAVEDGTALIVKKDGIPVGALGALLLPNTYNPNILTLAELFWYVLPEHRKSRVGAMLLNGYVELAKERADEATLSLLNTSKVNYSSLEKKGFQLEEKAFRLTVKD